MSRNINFFTFFVTNIVLFTLYIRTIYGASLLLYCRVVSLLADQRAYACGIRKNEKRTISLSLSHTHTHTHTHTRSKISAFFCSTQNSASQPVSCCSVPFNKVSQVVLIALRFWPVPFSRFIDSQSCCSF